MSARAVAAVVVLLVVLGVPVPVAAQDAPRGDIAILYSALKDSDTEETLNRGLVGSVAIYLSPWLGIVGEVGGHYKSFGDGEVSADIKFEAALGGIRLGQFAGRSRFFAQALAGATRASAGLAAGDLGFDASESFFTVQPGVGVDIGLSRSVGLRVQADYRTVKHDDEWSSQIRGSAGLVIAFGSR